MEKNSINNNKENTSISDNTNNMLALLRDFIQLQNRLIVVYDGEVGGENIIEASAELYRLMQDAITVNICENSQKHRQLSCNITHILKGTHGKNVAYLFCLHGN